MFFAVLPVIYVKVYFIYHFLVTFFSISLSQQMWIVSLCRQISCTNSRRLSIHGVSSEWLFTLQMIISLSWQWLLHSLSKNDRWYGCLLWFQNIDWWLTLLHINHVYCSHYGWCLSFFFLYHSPVALTEPNAFVRSLMSTWFSDSV